mgnify:CR=1 FL=1
MNKKMLLTLTTGCLLVTAMFTSCGQEREELSSAAAAHIYLSVNSEIKISYNNDGLVTEILGVNKDGKGIVSVYDNYIGKDCSDVVSKLVEEIHAAGYFVEEVEGEHKQIDCKGTFLKTKLLIQKSNHFSESVLVLPSLILL